MMRSVFAATCCCAVFAVSAHAQAVRADARQDVLAGISRCGGIANDRQWLDCVYGAAQPMRARLGLPPAPLSQQRLVPLPVPGQTASAFPAAPPQSKPGFFERMFTHTEEKPEPPTRLTSYRFDGAGRFTITLANGETWRQSGGDSVLAHWDGPPQTYVATVLPGTGNYHRLRVGSAVYMVQQVN